MRDERAGSTRDEYGDPVSADIRVTESCTAGVSLSLGGYGNAVAGWPVSSGLISRQDNPANLISTWPTSLDDPIPRFTVRDRAKDSAPRAGFNAGVLVLEIHFPYGESRCPISRVPVALNLGRELLTRPGLVEDDGVSVLRSRARKLRDASREGSSLRSPRVCVCVTRERAHRRPRK